MARTSITRKLIVRRLLLLAVVAIALFFATRNGHAEPARLPPMTQAQYEQVVQLCQLKRTAFKPPAEPGGDPIISQRHCDPWWDDKMKCANDNFGKAGKLARTSFTSEWICQIATPPSTIG